MALIIRAFISKHKFNWNVKNIKPIKLHGPWCKHKSLNVRLNVLSLNLYSGNPKINGNVKIHISLRPNFTTQRSGRTTWLPRHGIRSPLKKTKNTAKRFYHVQVCLSQRRGEGQGGVGQVHFYFQIYSSSTCFISPRAFKKTIHSSEER